jgi:hypothetical protein
MNRIKPLRLPARLLAIGLGSLLLVACDRQSDAPAASGDEPVAAAPVAPQPENQEHRNHQDHQRKEQQVSLMHVHGLAYTADGGSLLIPSHHGLAVFNGSDWSMAAGPGHDYMGFAITDDAMYSSGHPAPGSGLVNPFGVIRSTDGGKTWQNLGMEGESDFHLLAASYQGNALYVVNPAPNSKMKSPGIYATFNDGFSWQQAALQGLGSDPMSLAVHPTDPKTVAVGSAQGLFLSRDAANTFEPIADGRTVGVAFDLNGKQLWASIAGNEAQLLRIDLSADESHQVALPPLNEDAVAYIAQNPARRDTYAIATYKRNVYVSTDRGDTWTQIADQGKTMSPG